MWDPAWSSVHLPMSITLVGARPSASTMPTATLEKFFNDSFAVEYFEYVFTDQPVLTHATVLYNGFEYNTFNTLRPRQNGPHFADAIFKGILLKENAWILIKFSLKFVPKGPINNIPALVQIMAWRQPGDKPLSEPMVVSLLMHICITRPQWVKNNATSNRGQWVTMISKIQWNLKVLQCYINSRQVDWFRWLLSLISVMMQIIW